MANLDLRLIQGTATARLNQIEDPAVPTDAANMRYVDAAVQGVSTSIASLDDVGDVEYQEVIIKNSGTFTNRYGLFADADEDPLQTTESRYRLANGTAVFIQDGNTHIRLSNAAIGNGFRTNFGSGISAVRDPMTDPIYVVFGNEDPQINFALATDANTTPEVYRVLGTANNGNELVIQGTIPKARWIHNDNNTATRSGILEAAVYAIDPTTITVLTHPQEGEILVWNGSDWVNENPEHIQNNAVEQVYVTDASFPDATNDTQRNSRTREVMKDTNDNVTIPISVQPWVSGTGYAQNALVSFEGNIYRVTPATGVAPARITENPTVNTTDWSVISGSGASPELERFGESIEIDTSTTETHFYPDDIDLRMHTGQHSYLNFNDLKSVYFYDLVQFNTTSGADTVLPAGSRMAPEVVTNRNGTDTRFYRLPGNRKINIYNASGLQRSFGSSIGADPHSFNHSQTGGPVAGRLALVTATVNSQTVSYLFQSTHESEYTASGVVPSSVTDTTAIDGITNLEYMGAADTAISGTPFITEEGSARVTANTVFAFPSAASVSVGNTTPALVEAANQGQAITGLYPYSDRRGFTPSALDGTTFNNVIARGLTDIDLHQQIAIQNLITQMAGSVTVPFVEAERYTLATSHDIHWEEQGNPNVDFSGTIGQVITYDSGTGSDDIQIVTNADPLNSNFFESITVTFPASADAWLGTLATGGFVAQHPRGSAANVIYEITSNPAVTNRVVTLTPRCINSDNTRIIQNFPNMPRPEGTAYQFSRVDNILDPTTIATATDRYAFTNGEFFEFVEEIQGTDRFFSGSIRDIDNETQAPLTDLGGFSFVFNSPTPSWGGVVSFQIPTLSVEQENFVATAVTGSLMALHVRGRAYRFIMRVTDSVAGVDSQLMTLQMVSYADDERITGNPAVVPAAALLPLSTGDMVEFGIVQDTLLRESLATAVDGFDQVRNETTVNTMSRITQTSEIFQLQHDLAELQREAALGADFTIQNSGVAYPIHLDSRFTKTSWESVPTIANILQTTVSTIRSEPLDNTDNDQMINSISLIDAAEDHVSVFAPDFATFLGNSDADTAVLWLPRGEPTPLTFTGFNPLSPTVGESVQSANIFGPATINGMTYYLWFRAGAGWHISTVSATAAPWAFASPVSASDINRNNIPDRWFQLLAPAVAPPNPANLTAAITTASDFSDPDDDTIGDTLSTSFRNLLNDPILHDGNGNDVFINWEVDHLYGIELLETVGARVASNAERHFLLQNVPATGLPRDTRFRFYIDGLPRNGLAPQIVQSDFLYTQGVGGPNGTVDSNTITTPELLARRIQIGLGATTSLQLPGDDNLFFGGGTLTGSVTVVARAVTLSNLSLNGGSPGAFERQVRLPIGTQIVAGSATITLRAPLVINNTTVVLPEGTYTSPLNLTTTAFTAITVTAETFTAGSSYIVNVSDAAGLTALAAFDSSITSIPYRGYTFTATTGGSVPNNVRLQRVLWTCSGRTDTNGDWEITTEYFGDPDTGAAVGQLSSTGPRVDVFPPVSAPNISVRFIGDRTFPILSNYQEASAGSDVIRNWQSSSTDPSSDLTGSNQLLLLHVDSTDLTTGGRIIGTGGEWLNDGLSAGNIQMPDPSTRTYRLRITDYGSHNAADGTGDITDNDIARADLYHLNNLQTTTISVPGYSTNAFKTAFDAADSDRYFVINGNIELTGRLAIAGNTATLDMLMVNGLIPSVSFPAVLPTGTVISASGRSITLTAPLTINAASETTTSYTDSGSGALTATAFSTINTPGNNAVYAHLEAMDRIDGSLTRYLFRFDMSRLYHDNGDEAIPSMSAFETQVDGNFPMYRLIGTPTMASGVFSGAGTANPITNIIGGSYVSATDTLTVGDVELVQVRLARLKNDGSKTFVRSSGTLTHINITLDSAMYTQRFNRNAMTNVLESISYHTGHDATADVFFRKTFNRDMDGVLTSISTSTT